VAKIGYARVSTNDQHPEAQADRLKADGCERVFTDKGVSGRKASRPQWDKCLDHLREGDTLVVVRLDRMGRSVLNLIDVVNDLKAKGVDMRVIDQGIDTGTPAGKFFFHVMAALAEMEADMIRERTNDGLAAARARGRKGGRRAKLNDAQAAEVRRLYAAREKTVAEIGELYGITRESVYRYVKPAKQGGELGEGVSRLIGPLASARGLCRV
jgi:DNA invertase Pin-like site-specific DNA recombinase